MIDQQQMRPPPPLQTYPLFFIYLFILPLWDCCGCSVVQATEKGAVYPWSLITGSFIPSLIP